MEISKQITKITARTVHFIKCFVLFCHTKNFHKKPLYKPPKGCKNNTPKAFPPPQPNRSKRSPNERKFSQPGNTWWERRKRAEGWDWPPWDHMTPWQREQGTLYQLSSSCFSANLCCHWQQLPYATRPPQIPARSHWLGGNCGAASYCAGRLLGRVVQSLLSRKEHLFLPHCMNLKRVKVKPDEMVATTNGDVEARAFWSDRKKTSSAVSLSAHIWGDSHSWRPPLQSRPRPTFFVFHCQLFFICIFSDLWQGHC